MSRLEAVSALLWSLEDVQPSPKCSRSYDVRGEAPDSWTECENCAGKGLTQDRFGRETPCEPCGGKGRFQVDSHTGERISGEESAAPVRTRRVLCDRCAGTGVMPGRLSGETGIVRCTMCDGAGRVSVPLLPGESTSPQRVLDDGSPLQRLRSKGDWDRLEALGTPLPEQAVKLLSGPVKVPGDVLVAYRDRHRRLKLSEQARVGRVYRGGRKKRLVVEMLRNGSTVSEVAAYVGVTERQVRRLAA